MKKSLLLLSLLHLFIFPISAQMIDQYGISVGCSFANQIWEYTNPIMEVPDNKYRAGTAVFISAEKTVLKIISIRPEIGYVQRGYRSEMELLFEDGSVVKTDKPALSHTTALNLGVKVKPWDWKWSPYITSGVQANYRFAYRGVTFIEPVTGLTFDPHYASDVRRFNKFTLAGIAGAGIDHSTGIYAEIDYFPAISNTYHSDWLQVRDVCWLVRIGYRIQTKASTSGSTDIN